MNAGECIADFLLELKPDAAPSSALLTARRALLDTIAVAIAGRAEPASVAALGYAAGHAGPLMARVWAGGERAPVELAALVNGVMGHVLDYDDVTSPMRGHPSVVLLPPLLALAEARGASVSQLLTAYIAGFEVICRISRAIAQPHYAKGWHATSSIGVLGAAAALAHLLQLPRAQIVSALGLAVAQASGTIQNFGSMAKAFQAGHAGDSALRAALLAERGFTASDRALDGGKGFAALYVDGLALAPALRDIGGPPLEIEASGIEVKKYPMCYAAHRALDGLLDLKAEHPELTLETVEQVTISGSSGTFAPLIHDRPQTGLEGKFSLPYAAAAALADGAVRLSSFTDESVQRAPIQAFLPRVQRREVEGPLFPRWTELEIRLCDGDRLHRRVEALRGSAELPLSTAELLEKAEDCLRFGGYAGDTAHLAALLEADPAISIPALLDESLPRSPVAGR